jgi:ATP-dependent protease ClpP protease subunit
MVSVEGACMSAATIVFLMADEFEISAHSMFMFHNYSGGTIGKGGEMIDQIKHERKWSESLLNEIYSDFLNPDEIRSILDNKDIWMGGEEVVNRLNKRKKALQNKRKKTAK